MAHYLIVTTGETPDITIVEAKTIAKAVEQVSLTDGKEIEVYTLRAGQPRRFRLKTEVVTRLEAL